LTSKRRNISLFLTAAADYGVPDTFLFNPDDLAVMAHFYKVTRTLWALGERCKMDPGYRGPSLQEGQGGKQQLNKKNTTQSDNTETKGLDSIFANLMQDVQRRASLTPKGPPRDIYSCN